MKNLKRVLALVTILSMLLSVNAFAHVGQVDVDNTSYYGQYTEDNNVVGVTDSASEQATGWDNISSALGFADDVTTSTTENVTLTLDATETVTSNLDFSEKTYDVTIEAGNGFSGSALIVVDADSASGDTVTFKDVTIDGNEKTYEVVEVASGTLTLGDDATVQGSKTSRSHGGVEVKNGATLNVEDGAEITCNIAGIFNNDGGTVNINGGSVTSTGSDAATVHNDGSGTITVAGGAINANGDESVAINNEGTGRVVITGGTIGGTNNEVQNVAIANWSTGIVDISGGTVSASGEESVAIWNVSYFGAGDIQISGGTITSQGNGIQNGNYSSKGNVTISGGTINASGVTIDNLEGTGKTTVTGGTYSDNVSAYYDENIYTQLTEEVGNLAIGQVVLKTDLAAEETRLAEEAAEAARLAAEAEAARIAAELAASDDSDDSDDGSDEPVVVETPAPVTIEEEATPLAALPEAFTADDVASLAVDLGLAESVESYDFVAETTAETVSSVIESLTAGNENADAAAILADAGITPESVVSREQFATVIYALAGTAGFDTTVRADLAGKFTDADAVSAFAKEALEWAVETGIYRGTSQTTLDPKSTLTYDQLILVVSRYLSMLSAQ